ncbi:hypothetical protein BDP27DRAFT_1405540 [Rhodocollybia butyracea]|uniref:Uncharacterized protein n=1 Tax=Rhodocollybia butyracea TaxID=206335 RepID=A0A9P5PEX2_9AGAR|nr:hypothetical protein BDP27DRAFT_1405540 [Rhodocollybia butyracea]
MVVRVEVKTGISIVDTFGNLALLRKAMPSTLELGESSLMLPDLLSVVQLLITHDTTYCILREYTPLILLVSPKIRTQLEIGDSRIFETPAKKPPTGRKIFDTKCDVNRNDGGRGCCRGRRGARQMAFQHVSCLSPPRKDKRRQTGSVRGLARILKLQNSIQRLKAPKQLMMHEDGYELVTGISVIDD